MKLLGVVSFAIGCFLTSYVQAASVAKDKLSSAKTDAATQERSVSAESKMVATSNIRVRQCACNCSVPGQGNPPTPQPYPANGDCGSLNGKQCFGTDPAAPGKLNGCTYQEHKPTNCFERGVLWICSWWDDNILNSVAPSTK